jgi:PPOX class probable F420-dependent enzyme
MAEPTASRPTFAAAYGIAGDPEGMLPWSWATERLERARNYWVATTRGDGAPHAAAVWGLWREDAFVFSTALRSRKAENLRRDPRAVVHLESGDEVVLLEGRADEIVLDDELAAAYEAKYALRPERDPDQVWFRFRPAVGAAWRESDYTASATRFTFPRGA